MPLNLSLLSLRHNFLLLHFVHSSLHPAAWCCSSISLFVSLAVSQNNHNFWKRKFINFLRLKNNNSCQRICLSMSSDDLCLTRKHDNFLLQNSLSSSRIKNSDYLFISGRKFRSSFQNHTQKYYILQKSKLWLRTRNQLPSWRGMGNNAQFIGKGIWSWRTLNPNQNCLTRKRQKGTHTHTHTHLVNMWCNVSILWQPLCEGERRRCTLTRRTKVLKFFPWQSYCLPLIILILCSFFLLSSPSHEEKRIRRRNMTREKMEREWLPSKINFLNPPWKRLNQCSWGRKTALVLAHLATWFFLSLTQKLVSLLFT